MELNSEVINSAPRQAATVIMLRDVPLGLEVFLVRRHGLSDVLGGAYVFPGGKLDPSDCTLDEARHLDQTSAPLHSALAEPATDAATARGLYVAAVREAFEEAGVLFAKGITAAQTAAAARLLQQGMGFNDLLEKLDLRLHTQALLPWSRWITPRMPSVTNKRFDTRFFVAALPEGQLAQHDNHEATESVWLTPRAALEQYWAREIELAPPQIMTLAHLARHDSVASALASARNTPPPEILPEPFEHDGERVLCYPGNPRHSVAQRAMPGPTQLAFRNRRFEPDGGFEALFA
jgi:8-oxo-dGTP pyrophosphatase MutT (NUDIX family)